jgi:hypothetical protein
MVKIDTYLPSIAMQKNIICRESKKTKESKTSA